MSEFTDVFLEALEYDLVLGWPMDIHDAKEYVCEYWWRHGYPVEVARPDLGEEAEFEYEVDEMIEGLNDMFPMPKVLHFIEEDWDGNVVKEYCLIK